MPLLKEPVIVLEGVNVRALTLSALELELIIRVTNPNIFAVTLRDVPFTVSCGIGEKEQDLATGNAGNVKIPGNGSMVLTVPVSARNREIIQAVTSFVAEGGIVVTVRGTAVVDFIVTRPIPFTKSFRLTPRQLTDSLSGMPAPNKG
jgi:LEA14-like dessication related protein